MAGPARLALSMSMLTTLSMIFEVAARTSISTVSAPRKVLSVKFGIRCAAYCSGTTSFGSLPGVAPKSYGASAWAASIDAIRAAAAPSCLA